MASSLSDLRLAARSLRRSPGFTLIAVLTFALCIGANSAIFSLVNSVLLRPLPYDDPEKLVLLWESAPFFGLQDSPVAPANYFDWKARSRSFEEMGALEDASYRLTGIGEPEVVHGAVVTSSLWRTLRIRPAIGRLFDDNDDQPGAPRVAVVSDSFFRRRLAADRRILGSHILLNGEKTAVIGVLHPGAEPPAEYRSDTGEIWTPLSAAYRPEELANRGRHNWMVIARLKPGVPLAAADAEMKSIGRSLARDYPDTNEQVGAFAAPFRDHFVRHSRKTILLLLGTVAVLLLIGCANLANLLITRAAERAKEVAVRAALGAGRWPILRRFLWESLLLCGMGSLLGLFFAPLTFHSLAHFAPGALTGARTLDIDWRVAGFTFLLAAFTTAAFGLLPALQLRSLDIVDSLKRSARTVTSAAGAGRVRAVLVCAEVSLAFVLLIGAGLLIRAFASVRAVEPGFSTSNILVVRTPMPRGEGGAKTIAALQSELRRSIEALSGVVSAGFTNNIPILQKGNFSSVRVEGGDPGRTIQCLARTASPGYFSALGIPVTRGRAFDERDADGAPYTVIVSQSLANLAWPGQNPLGRKLVFTEKANATVVGVAADIRQQGLEAAPHPEFYISSLQAGFTSSSIVIRTSVEPTSLVPQVRATIRSFNPEQPITELASMEDVLEREVFQRRLQTTLLAGFASLALLLAALGLYGVLSHLIGQKTPEIGLRAALGAAPSDILGRILSQALRLTAAGLAIGLGVSFLAVRIVESYLFNVKPTDLSTYLAVAAALLLTAALASYLPARRALRIEPIQALREE